MRRRWLFRIVLVLLAGIVLTACAPRAIPTEDTPPATPAPTEPPVATPPGAPTDLPTSPPTAPGDQGAADPPAAQAARQALAQALSVDVSAITVAEVQPVEWRDACLGIHTPGQVCAQVITLGYRIVLEVQGKRYEYRTDENGQTALPVPGPVPPAGGVAIAWDEGGACQAAVLHADLGVAHGPCAGPLANVPLIGGTAARELAEFSRTYAPFYAETPVGRVSLAGLGAEFANDAIRRQIAEWARLEAEASIAGRTSAAHGLALSWHREGGIAGFCDDLAVYRDGRVIANSCKAPTPDAASPVWLDPVQLQQLYRWLDAFRPFEVHADDQAKADAMRTTLIFAGQGQRTASDADQNEILDWSARVYAWAQGDGP